MINWSPNKRRAITLLAVVPFVSFAANWIMGWHWLGRFDAYAALLSSMIFYFLLFVAWPGPNVIARLSYNTRRAITLVAALPFVLCAINWAMGWHWFGRYDRGVASLWMMMFIPFLLYVGPSPEEMREQDKKRKQQSNGHKS